MPLRHLFIDMNSFFASVEQQGQSRTSRNKAVAGYSDEGRDHRVHCRVLPPRAAGVKTGTPVWEARKRTWNRLRRRGPQAHVTMHNAL